MEEGKEKKEEGDEEEEIGGEGRYRCLSPRRLCGKLGLSSSHS